MVVTAFRRPNRRKENQKMLKKTDAFTHVFLHMRVIVRVFHEKLDNV